MKCFPTRKSVCSNFGKWSVPTRFLLRPDVIFKAGLSAGFVASSLTVFCRGIDPIFIIPNKRGQRGMTDQRPMESWKTRDPLPLYRHTLFCTKGSACTELGCIQYKSCETHTNNCRNPRCPIPPCIARRQLAHEADYVQFENLIYQCAMWATDICPIVPPLRDHSSLPSTASSTSSPSTSSGGQPSSQFRVPNMPPPRKRPRMPNPDEPKDDPSSKQ